MKQAPGEHAALLVPGKSVPENANLELKNQDQSSKVKAKELRAFCLKLVDGQEQPVRPTDVLTVARQIYFLAPRALYTATINDDSHFFQNQHTGGYLNLKKIEAPQFIERQKGKFTQGPAIPVHEFTNFLYREKRKSLILLDKSGDLFEYFPAQNKWQTLRANSPISGSPDPEFIDFCLIPTTDTLCLLDPERNQIWQLKLLPAGATTNPHLDRSFPEIMPWRLSPHDISVAQSIGLECDQITGTNTFFVLKQSGVISKILPLIQTSHKQAGLTNKLKNLRPSRLASATGMPLVVVERQNNRVQLINKSTGNSESICFPQSADLRGLTWLKEGFWIINGSQLQYIYLNAKQRESLYAQGNETIQTGLLSKQLEPAKLEPRLKGMTIPVARAQLPRHAGVYPGARRLYRYGVHEGLDFFNDCGPIGMGTPARAAATGKIVRIDTNFKDMSRVTFNKVMNECLKEHRTSDHNEDLFRGCQVWLDHGNNVITKYAHLDKVNPKLIAGQKVKAGDCLGYIGVSGTGQNLAGRKKYPHLHFEIWLDNHYLGWGLTPPETLGLLEDIFETKE
jgi:murein DD-endopeptidase MepM/ murein hydrolase activator NlpD